MINNANAACVGWENNCYTCSCSTDGCNGSQLCYGKDDKTGASCNVSQSCNTPQNNVYSCDCNGQVGNITYTQVSCGASSIKCIGEHAPNGSGRTCHYCATPVSPTGVPPRNPTGGVYYHSTSNVVQHPPTSANVTPPATGSPIPGLTLTLSGPANVANSENISYRLVISHDVSLGIPIESITVYNDTPVNTTFVDSNGQYSIDSTNKRAVWPLSIAGNQKGFNFILKPKTNNTTVSTFVYATTTAGASGPAPQGSPIGNACSAKYEGRGYCSGTYLFPYFGNDPGKALIASMICQAESNSDPFALNPVCPDYSVGLFQINLIAHCNGAYNQLHPSTCTLLDIRKRNQCETNYKNPEENIKYAVSLSQNGTRWTPWSTWPLASQRLQSCGGTSIAHQPSTNSPTPTRSPAIPTPIPTSTPIANGPVSPTGSFADPTIGTVGFCGFKNVGVRNTNRSPVYALGKGTIIGNFKDPAGVWRVHIDHTPPDRPAREIVSYYTKLDNLETDDISLKVNDTVKKGQEIGYMGNSEGEYYMEFFYFDGSFKSTMEIIYGIRCKEDMEIGNSL